MSPYGIETNGLTRYFNGLAAVEGLSLQVDAGEIFGFLGPNGAGKTTTIRMLCGLIRPSRGAARVAGYAIGEEDDAIRRRVGLLTETPGLYDQLSAERNLAFFAELYEVGDVSAQVERYLRQLGVWERRADPVGALSKGMRQKLAIARALLHEPQVLFLDEPTSSLDPEAARRVREFIAELKSEGRTIFLCTHNLEEADRLCDRVAVFNTHLLALDTPQALRRQLYGRAVVFHLAQVSPAMKRAVEALPFVHSAEGMENRLVVTLDDPERDNPVIVRKLVELGAEVQFVGEVRRTLEDVYMRLVRGQEGG